MFSSGNNSTRGNAMLSSDMPPLPQCLPLEPIKLGSQKCNRSGELRRVLGFPPGSKTEDHSFVVAHSKPPPSVAPEELKHFKESVLNTSRKARDRAKKFGESLFKLDEFREAQGSKKRQRTDLLPNERSGRANLSKMGSQIHGNLLEIGTRRLEDRAKSIGLKKRVRTSMADGRADGRSTSISRQLMITEKDKDMVRADCEGSVQIEEKIRILPVGGEGWDKKMKKKRSVGAVVNRVINGDREVKRAMNLKQSADSKLRSSDAHGFRSRSSPGVSGNNRLDDSFEPASSTACTVLRNELESGPLLKDRTTMVEQRVVAKGNKKTNIYGDNPVGSPRMVIKGKVSRAARTVSVMAVDSSPDFHPSSGTLEGWKQPTSVNRVSLLGVANNHKGPMSINSSSHPMARWSGQRPHKASRTRRENLVTPVSNLVEAQSSSKGFANSDISAGITSNGDNGSVISRNLDDNAPKFKMELENVPSSVGLSESEESGAGEIKLKEKGTDSSEIALNAVHKVPTRKSKMLIKKEIGDGVQRQGRSGRSMFLTSAAVPPVREKLENLPMMKQLRSTRPVSDKNKSKSGRPPSKKLTDPKAFAHSGQVQNGGFSDFTGESDDDHEELLAAAKSAHNASKLACSSPFWREVESFFAPVSSEDTSYLKLQQRFVEELSESLSQIFGNEYNVLGVLTHEEVSLCSGEKQGSHSNQESAKADALINASCGKFDVGRRLDKVTPLYQRVLSALIEDASEEFYHHSEGKNMSFQYASDDSHCGSCNHIDVEPKDGDKMESEVESKVDFVTQQNCSLDRFSCEKSATSNPFRNPSMCNSLYNNEQWQEDDGLSHSDVGFVPEICQNDLDGLQPRQINISGISSSNCQYQLMCVDDRLLLELQSIGLYPETLPNLAEGEEVINQNIIELEEGLYEQVGKKKKNLMKIDDAIQNGRDAERRDIEQVAMNQLVEMAYKKQMACRGSNTSKSVVRKVTKQAALAFVKRTLARCKKFDNMGRSCFSEPALRDVIFSATPCSTEAKSVDCVGSGTASNTYNEACNHQTEARGSAAGADSRTLERHDSYSDNLDRDSSDAIQPIIHSSEQAFSKHEPVLNKEKREVNLDDVVGSTSSRVMSALGSTALGEVKAKRSERERDLSRDILTSNSVSTAGRSSLGSFKGERKTKPKSKQKTNHSSTTGNGFPERLTELTHPLSPSVRGSSQSVANGSNKVSREVGLPSPVGIPKNSSKATEETIDFASLQLHEFDSIEELGPSNEPGVHQDLDSWFNFDVDGLHEHFSQGLEVPMDDLSELNLV